jgi:hypothetical protein
MESVVPFNAKPFFERSKYGKKLAKNLFQAEPMEEVKNSFVKREVKHCSGLKITNSERLFDGGNNSNAEFVVAVDFISEVRLMVYFT